MTTIRLYVYTFVSPILPPSGGARANPDEQDFAQAVQAVGR